MWQHYERVADFAELSDKFFVRIFHGVTGSSANLRLGFRCNQNCGFCWQGRHWPEPPTEVFLKWLDEIGSAGIRQLIVTGGEPTLHGALPDILERAHKRFGMKTMLQTNAILLRKPALLKRIVAAGLERLFVSLHSADAAISDRMTHAPGTFDGTVLGVEAALAAGLRVGLNCIVERANYQGLGEHARFIVERFVRPFPDNPMESVNYSRPQAYHDRALWQQSLVALDEVEPHLLQAVAELQAAGVQLDITAGSCGLPACLLREFPDLIYLPEAQDVGQADPEFDPSGRSRGACGRCALSQRCQGPGAGYQQKYGDRGLVPFSTAPAVQSRFPLSLGSTD